MCDDRILSLDVDELLQAEDDRDRYRDERDRYRKALEELREYVTGERLPLVSRITTRIDAALHGRVR